MRPIYVSIALAASVANAVSLSQTPLAAGNLLINGGSASNGIATFNNQRQLLFTFAADESARTFTIYGTDANDNPISESLAGGVATAVSVNHYSTVTRIAVNAATAGALTVGTNGVGSTNAIPLDQYLDPTNVAVAIEILPGVVVNCTVQYTYDDIFSASSILAGINWIDHPILAVLSQSADGNFSTPPAACRLKINSGTGSAKIIIRQAGALG